MDKFLYRQLAKAGSLGFVIPGQDALLHVDLALGHDGTGPALLDYWIQNDIKRVACRKALFTIDHAFPAPTIKDRKFQKEFTEFSSEHGFKLYDHGEGVLHQVVAEEESIWPGMIIVGADGHVATAGAFGAIAFSVSPQKLVSVLETGHFVTVVPEQFTISIDGFLAKNTLPRDVALYIVSRLQKDIKGKAIALTGSLFNQLSLAGKMCICNYLPEGGAQTAFVLPDGEEDSIDFYLGAEHIEPLVALPPDPTMIRAVHEEAGTKITVAVAGGCSAGRLEDMKIIANTLEGKKIHAGVLFIVTPASRKVLDSMESSGISRIIRDAGVVIMPPGCGSCPGRHFGVLADDDVAVTTTIRNTPGRMGSEKARIYLASPLTVAMAALHGQITVF